MYLETLIRRAQANPKLVEVARRWVDSLLPLRKDWQSLEAALTTSDPFPILREVVVDRAYNLSAFVLGDRKSARKVALDVAASLEVPYEIIKESALTSGRSEHKYKVKDPSILLDQLIYKKATVYERQQELEHRRGGRQLDEEAMTIRFVKKIIEYGINHNTFYTVAGLHRVLFNHPVNEARLIYQLLVPCADIKKPGTDDFRHHKKCFIDLLERRFDGFIEVVESGEQNERRFKKRVDSRFMRPLVEETLNVFTPSLTDCPLLSGMLENIDDVRRSLYSNASIQENEDNNLIERKRMHMLTHRPCFSRLQGLLGIAPIEQVLEIPMFNMTNGGDGSGSPPLDRRKIPPLTIDDKKRMFTELDRRRRRSKRVRLEKVQVVVDDVERSTLSLNESRPAIFELEEGAGVIEFRGNDEEGSLPLAMHSLSWDESELSDEPESYRLRMKGGREVKFTIAHSRDHNGIFSGAKVVCSYSKVRQPIIVPLSLSRIRPWLVRLAHLPVLRSPALRTAGMAAVNILALSAALYIVTIKSPVHYVPGEQFGKISVSGLNSAIDPTQPATWTGSANLSHAQTANLSKHPNSAAPLTDLRSGKPHVAGRVTIRDDGEVIDISSDLQPQPTLPEGEITRSEVSIDHSGSLAHGAETVSLSVSAKRYFVKITGLPLMSHSATTSLSTFRDAKRIFVKPFAHNTLSQDVYSKLIKDLQASHYTLSRRMSDAEVILQGTVMTNASNVRLTVLLNNSDGSLICLKSVTSRIASGDEHSVAAELSAKAVKSFSEERGENTYVAVDYFLSQTTTSESQSALKLLDDNASITALDKPEALSREGDATDLPVPAGF